MPDRCDPFLLRYSVSERRIASEFLTTWMPFLSRDLCHGCVKILSDRIHSLSSETDGAVEPSSSGENTSALTTNDEYGDAGNCDSHSLGSWKDEGEETNSLGIWKDESKGLSDPAVADVSAQEMVGENAPVESTSVRMSWADMAQEDELEQEGDNEINKLSGDGDGSSGEMGSAARRRTELSRDQREYLRFMNVKRKKDFICLERINGKIVNILQGLELHTGVFSAVEQKRIVDYIYSLQEMGSKGDLKERTYTAPRKWMRGKGRVTVQFGCCYNYATDKNGNPPGILQNEEVDPLPPLFKVIIRRLVKWHVLPPSCVPDSCIVNVYDEGDCIPPHIDNHDFVRPFCTISFLSECNIVFGTDLKIVGPGEFDGAFAIPLPVGSVLVLNGNGADVAKHCVPAVPSKRISITFRKMDESKRPIGYAPEPDLQGLEPLRYMDEPSRKSTPPHHRSRQPMDESRRPIEPDWQGWRNGPRQSSRGGFGFRSEGRRVEEGRYSSRNRGGPRARVNLG